MKLYDLSKSALGSPLGVSDAVCTGAPGGVVMTTDGACPLPPDCIAGGALTDALLDAGAPVAGGAPETRAPVPLGAAAAVGAAIVGATDATLPGIEPGPVVAPVGMDPGGRIAGPP